MEVQKKAYLAIITQSIIIGFSFFFVKIGLQSADAFTLLAHRFIFAAAGILLYHYLRPGVITLKATDWMRIIPYGLFYPLLFFSFQTIGLTFISSSEAGIISATAPVFTVIIARLVLDERLTSVQMLFMSASVIGMVFINIMTGINPENGSFWGFFFIICSMLSAAFYNVLMKKILKHYSVIEIVFVMTIVSCVVFNAIAIIGHAKNGDLSSYFSPYRNLSFTISILYLGIPSSLITSFLSTFALSKLRSSTVGLFNNIPPVISIIAGVAFLHEVLYWYHLVGIAVILIGTVGYNLVERDRVT